MGGGRDDGLDARGEGLYKGLDSTPRPHVPHCTHTLLGHLRGLCIIRAWGGDTGVLEHAGDEQGR